MHTEKIRLGGENSPCMPHRFSNKDYSLITAVETSYKYHDNQEKKRVVMMELSLK
jgi:hypothetical protein